jgi:hypothetical protein
MGAGDFLRTAAETPLQEQFLVAGVEASIATNSEPILAAARDSYCPLDRPATQPKLRLRFWVDPRGNSQPPWQKPYFRGLDHLIFGGFDSQNSFLVDLKSKSAFGRFSPAMGSEVEFWKARVFPAITSILAASVGITELHAGCVAREGRGILLAGESGSGKSTLALAFAQAGFRYLSDDRTYLSRAAGDLRAWGLSTQIKLRPEGARWFEDLAGLRSEVGRNPMESLWFDPVVNLGLERAKSCQPACVVFLHRRECTGFDLFKMSCEEAAAQLQGELMAEEPEAAKTQRSLIETVAKIPCWKLKYGGSPHSVARCLEARLFK